MTVEREAKGPGEHLKANVLLCRPFIIPCSPQICLSRSECPAMIPETHVFATVEMVNNKCFYNVHWRAHFGSTYIKMFPGLSIFPGIEMPSFILFVTI